MPKTKIPIRILNESNSIGLVDINPDQLKGVQIFQDEVFATIDDIRIAIRIDDYNKLFKDEE